MISQSGVVEVWFRWPVTVAIVTSLSVTVWDGAHALLPSSRLIKRLRADRLAAHWPLLVFNAARPKAQPLVAPVVRRSSGVAGWMTLPELAPAPQPGRLRQREHDSEVAPVANLLRAANRECVRALGI